MLGIEDLDLRAPDDVLGQHLLRALRFDPDDLPLRVVQLEPYFFQIQNDIGHVLGGALDGGKFVQRVVNLDGGDSRAPERRQQDAAQTVADGLAEPSLEGFTDEFTVGRGQALLVDLYSVRFDQFAPMLLHRISNTVR